MHIKTTAGELKKALKTVRPAVELKGKRGALPIFGCVLIDGASVTACNLNLRIRAGFAAVSAKGSAAVSFKQVSRLADGLPADMDIELIQHDRSGSLPLVLNFDGGSYDLLSMPAGDFPVMDMPPAEEMPVPEGFCDALRAVQPFISTEETRYYLNGVCLSKDKSGAYALVATDGHRLGVHRVDLPVDGEPILPRVTVAALAGLPCPTHCAFPPPDVDKDGRPCNPLWARFRFPGGELVSKLIDGTYPDWRRVVPEKRSGQPRLNLDRAEALAVLRRIAGPGSQKAMMIAAEGENVVFCRKAEMESLTGRELLRAAVVTDWKPGFFWCFDGHYLAEVLKTFRNDWAVAMTSKGDGDPCTIEGDDARFFCVVMPMRAGDAEFARKSLSLFAGRERAA